MIWLMRAETAVVIAVTWMAIGILAAIGWHLWLTWTRRRR